MNNKSKITLGILIALISILVLEVIYISVKKKNSISQKNEFVSLLQLPDLAICTEATYLRHRSMSTTASIFKDDPLLLEYFPATFTYKASSLTKNTPQQITTP